MADFLVQINNFQNNGTYNYVFDEAGNEILNPSSSIFQNHFIAFPTTNVDYDNSKIMSFYDPNLREFIPSTNPTGSGNVIPQNIIDQINEVTQKNQVLSAQLDDLIAKSELDSRDADAQAVKDIILTLRIKLGQGTVITDFYDQFPYLPIPLDRKNTVG